MVGTFSGGDERLGEEGGESYGKHSAWNTINVQSLLSAVLVYLDRVYCNESTGIASIKELAIVTFRKGIWENQLLFQKTRDDLLSWASGEREAGA